MDIDPSQKKHIHTKIWMQIFLTAFFILPKTGHNPSHPQLKNEQTKCGISIQQNTTQH